MDTKRNGLKTVVASPTLTSLLGNTSKCVFSPDSLVTEFPVQRIKQNLPEKISVLDDAIQPRTVGEIRKQPWDVDGLARYMERNGLENYREMKSGQKISPYIIEWNFVEEPGINMRKLMDDWMELMQRPRYTEHVVIIPLEKFNKVFKQHQPAYMLAAPHEDYRVDKHYALNLLATVFGATAEDDRYEMMFDELSEDDGTAMLDGNILEDEYQKMCALYEVLSPMLKQAMPTDDVESEVSLERLYDDEVHFRIRV